MKDKSCCGREQSQHPSHESEMSNLNRVSGQIDGIKKMIDERRYCPEILTQLRAIRSAIKNIEARILETHLSSCVSQTFLSPRLEDRRKKIDEICDLLKRYE